MIQHSGVGMYRPGSWIGAGLLFAVGCAGTQDQPRGADGVDVRVQSAALSEEDKNKYRERKTDKKTLIKRKEDCSNDPRVALDQISLEICVGADLFFREAFGGNGRACGSCHAAQFDFTISPEFIASLPSDDPLFVAQNDPVLAQLEFPDLMRGFGLILENVDGDDEPTSKFVMRAVPHTFSLQTSINPPDPPSDVVHDGVNDLPANRTGWSGDGAPGPGDLRHFQQGAIRQHYPKSLARVPGVDFIPATDEQLDLIDAFLMSIGRTDDVDLDMIILSDADADAGRITFKNSRCNGCHKNAGARAGGANRNFDTGVEKVRVELVENLMLPHDGGFGRVPEGAAFNHDADGDGINDSYGDGTFNTTPLIEAADTPPFFHTNAVTTIEDAIRFYTEEDGAFANSPAGSMGGGRIVLSDTEVVNIGKFLRVMNASFNLKLAEARLQSMVEVTLDQKNHFKGLQFGLLDAAQAEIRDALSVLGDVGIHADEQAELAMADEEITEAFSNSAHQQRADRAQTALAQVRAAQAGLGSGLDFAIGPGSIMF